MNLHENELIGILQASIVLFIMMANSMIWWRRKTFSAAKHTTNYFIAALCLISAAPIKATDAVSNNKLVAINFTSFLFQIAIS